MDIDLKQLKEIMRSLKQFDVTELEIERDGQRVRMVREQPGTGASAPQGANVTITPQFAATSMPAQPAQEMPAAALWPAAQPAAAEAKADDPNVHYITSPFVGTFYSAPSPEADAFVKVGSQISVGQSLCIVEAMKLMNEIDADVAGEVLEVLAVNGKPVEYGDRLFKVKKA